MCYLSSCLLITILAINYIPRKGTRLLHMRWYSAIRRRTLRVAPVIIQVEVFMQSNNAFATYDTIRFTYLIPFRVYNAYVTYTCVNLQKFKIKNNHAHLVIKQPHTTVELRIHV